MNELTPEQHLKNLEIAVVKMTGTYDELTALRTSFVFIRDLVMNPEEKKGGKEETKP